MGRHLIPEERETICSTSDADDFWHVYTASPKHIRRLEKLGYKSTSVDNPYGYVHFVVRDGGIGFRSSEKKKINMTKEHKEALLKGRINLKLIDTMKNSKANSKKQG
jgi:hypothetical protein